MLQLISLQNIENAENNLETKIKISSCRPETTRVEFIIKPKEGVAGKEVKFFESVSKDCIEDLGKLLQKLEGGDTDIIMKADPLIVWTFDNVDKEKRVAYEISKYIEEECRDELRATAGAVRIEDKKTNQPITPPAEQKEHPQRFNPEHIITLSDTDSLKKELKVLKREFEREEGKIEAPDAISLSGADVEIDLDRIPNFAGVPDADIRVPDGCIKTGRKVKCPHDKADDDGDIGIHVERDGKRERSVDVNVGRRGEGGKLVLDFSRLVGNIDPKDNGAGIGKITIFKTTVNKEQILKNVVDGENWNKLIRISMTDTGGADCSALGVSENYQSDIECNVDGVSEGLHTINVEIEDKNGNTAKGSFVLTVI